MRCACARSPHATATEESAITKDGADRLYQDPDLAEFYDFDNGWGPDLEFCNELAQDAASVLDLGCGTGRFAAHLATRGCRVVGVDPARAMLDIAAARPGGSAAEWVEADARSLRLGRQFDLIVLTGHAFQVFLTREDRQLVLETIAAHLSPAGRFIFDSRNPDRREWLEWTPERSREVRDHPRLGRLVSWNEVEYDPATGIVTYETHYRLEDGSRHHFARSRIAFLEKSEIEALMAASGLVAERWLGDWRGSPWNPAAAEIIPLGRLS